MSNTATAAKPTVIVGVAGGIAAFKALEVIRLLSESGLNVKVVPTLSALRFIGEASFAALSGNEVSTDVWSDVHNVPHVALAREASAVVIVPATADLLARTASGRADDLLTAVILTATCPVIYAPAMHTEMWENSATVANVETLRSRGAVVLEPAVGRLTGADSGKGRLPDPASIAAMVHHAVSVGTSNDLAGKHVVVTAGGTREAIDPVRFIGNRSSGRQGYALASVAALRGARVTLISANSHLPAPAGVDVIEVISTADMQSVLRDIAPTADAIVMAAAVADFRPVSVSETKLKKSSMQSPQVELAHNPDLLSELVAHRVPGQVIVGFAAETGDTHADVITYGQQKLIDKGCDALVINSVAEGKGFESSHNEVTIVQPAAAPIEVLHTTKELVAETVWHVVTSLWNPA
ncbi:MAG: hypothetical protein RIS75_780 [Actinomycetota bacterium]|jgi:phosphopantothenoylcysteine decarboxylase/phosphopantothenate--cysteine ligase